LYTNIVYKPNRGVQMDKNAVGLQATNLTVWQLCKATIMSYI